MAFVAARNRYSLPGGSFNAEELENQFFSPGQHTAAEYSSLYSSAVSSSADTQHQDIARMQDFDMEAEPAEEDYYMSALVEEMAQAMLNEESETAEEESNAHEATSWESTPYNLSEKNLSPFQEAWLQRDGTSHVEKPSQNFLHRLGHICLTDGKRPRPFLVSQTSLANVEASSELNAFVSESVWRDPSKREPARNHWIIHASQLPPLIKAMAYYPKRQHTQRNLIYPNFWKPFNHHCISNKCNRTNKFPYQESKSNLKLFQNNSESVELSNSSSTHCASIQSSDGANGVRGVFLARTGAVRESVGTGFFLPRSRTRSNDSNGTTARLRAKSLASSNSKAPANYKYNSSMAFSSENKKISRQAAAFTESRLPPEWTY